MSAPLNRHCFLLLLQGRLAKKTSNPCIRAGVTHLVSLILLFGCCSKDRKMDWRWVHFIISNVKDPLNKVMVPAQSPAIPSQSEDGRVIVANASVAQAATFPGSALHSPTWPWFNQVRKTELKGLEMSKMTTTLWPMRWAKNGRGIYPRLPGIYLLLPGIYL